eukprot:6492218-Amphidinium_carterae.2
MLVPMLTIQGVVALTSSNTERVHVLRQDCGMIRSRCRRDRSRDHRVEVRVLLNSPPGGSSVVA